MPVASPSSASILPQPRTRTLKKKLQYQISRLFGIFEPAQLLALSHANPNTSVTFLFVSFFRAALLVVAKFVIALPLTWVVSLSRSLGQTVRNEFILQKGVSTISSIYFFHGTTSFPNINSPPTPLSFLVRTFPHSFFSEEPDPLAY